VVGVGSGCVKAVGTGSCASAGRKGRDWFQTGADAPGLGKAPNDHKSSLLCNYLSLNDLRLR
jgi:hypothetical protein